jgi:SnoaL-like domain
VILFRLSTTTIDRVEDRSKEENLRIMTKGTWIGALALICLLGLDKNPLSAVRAAEAGGGAGASADRVLILDLMNRYGAVHDFGSPEEYADLFTADGAIMVGNGPALAKGRDALIAMAKSDHERFSEEPGPDGKTSSIMRHLITNAQISLTGPDTADGTSYVTTIVKKGDIGPAILSVGRYKDQFLKQNGEWRIARRQIFLDFGDNELGKKLGFGK